MNLRKLTKKLKLRTNFIDSLGKSNSYFITIYNDICLLYFRDFFLDCHRENFLWRNLSCYRNPNRATKNVLQGFLPCGIIGECKPSGSRLDPDAGLRKLQQAPVQDTVLVGRVTVARSCCRYRGIIHSLTAYSPMDVLLC